MPSLDDYYRDLELMDGPPPSYGRPQTDGPWPVDLGWRDLNEQQRNKIVEPFRQYHDAMNNVQMSGPARDGRSTIVTGREDQDVFPYGTMFPTFPERPATDAFDINYYPGEAVQINDYFRNKAGISYNQSYGRMLDERSDNYLFNLADSLSGGNPNYMQGQFFRDNNIPVEGFADTGGGFSLVPTHNEWQIINQARGLPAFPVRIAPPKPPGLLDEIQNFYRNIFS